MLYNYSYKPEPIFGYRNSDAPTALTFGLEDETDCGRRDRIVPTTDKIDAYTNRVYCKKDSSIPNGFEIVSHPSTLGHHMYETPWKYILRTAQKNGFKSHDAGTAGLHIHVGRKQLGRNETERDVTIRKIIVLTYRHWDSLVRYSRRRSEDLFWCARNRVPGYSPDMEITDEWAEENIPTWNNHANRYYCINCENDSTIEFRICRGTLKRDTLIAAIQLVSNICEYAMSHTWEEIQHSNWLDVAQFRHYNENDAYLVVRGFTPSYTPTYNTQRTPTFGGRDGIDGAN